MPTTSQLLNITPAEKAAAVFTAAGEGGRQDAPGIFATLLTRKAKSNDPLHVEAKKAHQFVANDPYTLKQITDPQIGRQIYGKLYTDLESQFEDSQQLIHGFQVTQGATQFRGQASLPYKKKGDPMFHSKGNFWLPESANRGIAETFIQQLQKGRKRASADEEQPQNIASAGGNTYVFLTGDDSETGDLSPGGQFLQFYKDTVLPQYQEKQADILKLAGSVPSFIDTMGA